MSNKGLRIHTFIHPTQGSEDVVMPLHCHTQGKNGQKTPQLGLFLKHERASVYFRVRPHTLATLPEHSLNSGGNDIFVSKRFKPRIAPAVAHNALGAVYFQIKGLEDGAAVRLVETGPRELWDAQNRVFVTSGLRSFVAFHRFQLVGNYTGIVTVACGFSEDNPTQPWVHMEDMLGALYPAASARDYRAIAQIGASKGSLKTRKQDLMMLVVTSNTMKARFGVAKLQCEQRTRSDGETILVVNLELKKNNAVLFHLFK
ncbi:HET-domain-containing protein [Apiospora marii]|uniref:HET-domain-containing protein n=1 Tax=Apiospora marii TaxID=335849 RepID=UPI00312CCB3E